MKNENVVKLGVLFFMVSIFGYFYELILCLIYNDKLISHGILYGPWLPIYGTGAILISMLNKYRKSPFIIFFSSFFLAGTLEYLCGIVLLKIFKMRLWDYTGMFLNIDGLVCLLSAFCFGIGGLIIIYLLIPLINKLLKKINFKKIKIILLLLSGLFLGDIILSSLN